MEGDDATTPSEDQETSTATNEVAIEQELKEIKDFISEVSNRFSTKNEMRQKNTSLTPKPEEYFFKLDSNLKKNTTFVKKIKQFTATQLESFLKDLDGLNLTKYISEVCQSLVEAKLKMTDVMPAVQLCSKFHEIYSEFSQIFFQNWQKVLTLKHTETVANPSKMRVDLRFFAELLLAGIFQNRTGLGLLGLALIALINQDKEEFANLNIILSFCKNCGDEFAGLCPQRMLELAKKHNLEIPKSSFLPPDKQQNLRNLLKDYYTSLCGYVKRQHKEVMDAERSNKYSMSSKGEVSDQKKEKLDQLQSAFDKLIAATQTLSDLLGEPMPSLPKPVDTNEGHIISEDLSLLDQELDPWGDEETKSFYVDLPDLRDFLPNYAPKEADLMPAEAPMTEDVLDTEIAPEQLQLDETVTQVDEEGGSTVEIGAEEPATEEIPADVLPITPSQINTEAKPDVNYNSKQYYDIFVKNLNKCVNRTLIDSAAIEFLVHMNTKNNRKKICRSIFGVQRTRLDLLPGLSRFVAILTLVSKDVINELIKLLNNEFKHHVREKDQIKIESKIKVVRFIGELVKFGLYPRIDALFFLKVLLHDFYHHNIEMVCAMLDVCGVYLYNCKESRLRTNAYLEQMMRLKTVNAFDSRHTALIESAYYAIKAPEGRKVQQKVRTPVQRYIRYLIFEELNKSTVDKVIRAMRTLNWDDKATVDYIVKCLIKAHALRYHLIRCLADLVSGLSSYQDRHMIRVIDAVFEDIRAGLEIDAGTEQLAQRRVAMVKYLGEMYIHRLVEKAEILNTLYTIISLGVTWDHNILSHMDPPKSLFRLKMVCVLLETCGEYFTTTSSRKRMDYFLIFFQQYYWFKKSHPMYVDAEEKDLFPILTDYMYKDCLKKLRPQLKLYQSYEEASEAVEKLRLQLFPNIGTESSGINASEGGASTATGESSGALGTLTEQEESDNDASDGDDTSEVAGDESEDDADRNEEDFGDEDDDEEDELGEEEEVEECQLAVAKEVEKTQEDLDFESAFDRMTIDCHQERIRETSVKPAVKEIPVPIMSKSTKKTYENLHKPVEPEETASVPFVLMMRGGKAGKQQLKSFSAPADSQLAVNLKMQEAKMREEHESVKRLTLDITERNEAEDYEESQRYQQPIRQPKISKPPKFKYNKGAPDVDAIFH